MFEGFVTFIIEKISDFGYFGIFILMTIDSGGFIPFPSEIVMVPAGYLSSTGEMNIYLALLAGTLGSLFGAIFNYYLGVKLGGPLIRSLINKYGKYVLIKVEHYDKAEGFFKKHGSITTFNFRFIPGVRQLISLPAGVFKMDFTKFVIYTTLGTGIWNCILLLIGYIAGENKDLISKYSKEAVILTVLLIIVLSIGYYLFNKYFNKVKK